MDVMLKEAGSDSWDCQAAILLFYESQPLDEILAGTRLAEISPWMAAPQGFEDFKGKEGEIAVFYGSGPIPRLICAGLGKLDELNLSIFRDSMALAAQKCHELHLSSSILPVNSLDHLPGGRDRLIEEAVYSFTLALYNFDKYKTVNVEKEPAPCLALGTTGQDPNAARAVQRGQAAAEGVSMARNLANMPGNDLYPESLAAYAAQVASQYGLSCKVLDENALAEMQAGCILGVGSGSAHPPRLIIIEYTPAGHEQDKPLVYIGKGITFDSGGLCLKPPANMNQMKCDMSGAAAVLAAVAMSSKLGVQRRLIGVLSCAENMPDGRAYRPGDILRALNGETVEIVNTDAEGRLVLADALSYVQKNWTPAAIIDIATLTGACAVALGGDIAGLFCENEDFAHRIMSFGRTGGENYWQLPLWQPYAKSLKSDIADIKHTANREGGAITAALFLKNFVKSGNRWAHLDIAGVDWCGRKTPLCPVGATGFGTRTLLALAYGGIE